MGGPPIAVALQFPTAVTTTSTDASMSRVMSPRLRRPSGRPGNPSESDGASARPRGINSGPAAAADAYTAHRLEDTIDSES